MFGGSTSIATRPAKIPNTAQIIVFGNSIRYVMTIEKCEIGEVSSAASSPPLTYPVTPLSLPSVVPFSTNALSLTTKVASVVVKKYSPLFHSAPAEEVETLRMRIIVDHVLSIRAQPHWANCSHWTYVSSVFMRLDCQK